MIVSRAIYVSTNGIISFYLWLSNILHMWVCMCVLYTHHIFFIYLPVIGHSFCLAIINSAAINIRVGNIFLKYSFCLFLIWRAASWGRKESDMTERLN